MSKSEFVRAVFAEIERIEKCRTQVDPFEDCLQKGVIKGLRKAICLLVNDARGDGACWGGTHPTEVSSGDEVQNIGV